MRLSEAIRLGAMLRPQAFHGLFKDGGSCALGAALDAMGITDEEAFQRRLSLFEGASQIRVMVPPCCRCLVDLHEVDAVIVHLNDTHQWTREQIADWVETLEQASAEPAPLAAVDPVDGRVAEVQRA